MPFPNPQTQFQPGERWNGNAGGRPKGRSLTARVRELLEKGEIDGKPIKDGRQIADLLAESVLMNALKGDASILNQLWNRLEGKVPDRFAGPDGGNPTIEHLVKVVRVASMDDL